MDIEMERTALYKRRNAMTNGILHERLDQQGRDQAAVAVLFHLPIDREPLPVTDSLDVEKAFDEPELFGDGNLLLPAKDE